MTDAQGPIKFAVVNESTAASNEIVAAVTDRRIRVLGLVLAAASAVNVTIEDEDGNDIIGLCALTANDLKLVLPTSGIGYGETATVTKALHLLSSGAVQVGGSIVYQEVL